MTGRRGRAALPRALPEVRPIFPVNRPWWPRLSKHAPLSLQAHSRARGRRMPLRMAALTAPVAPLRVRPVTPTRPVVLELHSADYFFENIFDECRSSGQLSMECLGRLGNLLSQLHSWRYRLISLMLALHVSYNVQALKRVRGRKSLNKMVDSLVPAAPRRAKRAIPRHLVVRRYPLAAAQITYLTSYYAAVDCQWTAWSAWDTCNATCAPGGTSSIAQYFLLVAHCALGTQARTRTETPAQNGGAACVGNSRETQTCNADVSCRSHFRLLP